MNPSRLFRGPQSETPARRPRGVRLGLEMFEDRSVPAAAFNPASGLLAITGTAGSDSVQVTMSQNFFGWTTTVTENGQVTATVQDSGSATGPRAVRTIRFAGGSGHDGFTYTAPAKLAAAVDADGGSGDDRLRGGPGPDTLVGGSGTDVVYGNAGNDRLFAGTRDGGGDAVFDPPAVGGEPDRGGSGTYPNSVYGGTGDDVLVGSAGTDWLYGEAGDDGLFGGRGMNRLWGGPDDDRILDWDRGDDHAQDLTDRDAVVRFARGTDQVHGGTAHTGKDWTEFEILRVDALGLARLQARTDNATLLRNGDDGLVFARFDGLNPRASAWASRPNVIAMPDNMFQLGISARDFEFVVIHEVGHHWHGVNGQVKFPHFVAFKAISGWTTTDPNDPAYTSNGAGSWYLTGSEFYSDYAKTNALEDFAESFAATIMGDTSRIPQKSQLINDWLASISG